MIGKAIKKRAEEVLKELEALPAAQRSELYDFAVEAAKEAKRLALGNPIAASVQLGEAQSELPDCQAKAVQPKKGRA